MTTVNNRNKLEVEERVIGNVLPIGMSLLDNDGSVSDLSGLTLNAEFIDMADNSIVGPQVPVTVVSGNQVTFTPDPLHVNAARRCAVYVFSDTGVRWPHDGARHQLHVKTRADGS